MFPPIVKRAGLVLAVIAAAACGPPPPPPPPRPALVALDVRFTTLEVIDDMEGGSGDWRVTLMVDGKPLGRPVLGEADAGGAVPLDRTATSEGREASHRLVITVKVEEHDGGFDSTWEFVGEKTLDFGVAERFGVGGQTVEIDDEEGKVNLRFVVTRRP